MGVGDAAWLVAGRGPLMTIASAQIGVQATRPRLYREEEGRGKHQPTQ